eukprot:CAMPEP_0172562424 /NCGR_PEP_ID=MMETSP1067-20121228/96786_1 /TAXON_ID=265564 ORGANISM="Thalassiosira punctigera, Strain Tpunct2005C2" /NCGR_SAMPLE_ID=MMETSP1067 /ASSEMBLY_ACC=CAM_ASM_000444 /LENGTH=821 /DNA_ID=CAMNT_0013352637 /DNA_START=144 /DNA_END=2606 /DNA_ORIENTATION=-
MFSTAAMPRLFSNGSKQPAAAPQDHSRSPRHHHRSSFKSALEHISVTDAFLRGINAFRVTSKGKLEPATLTISSDKFIISVLPRTLKLERTASSGGSGLKRPSILSRVRSNGASIGSVGSNSVGGNSLDGADAGFSSNPQLVVDIGSIDRIQSGQNTLLFEKARQRERRQSMSTRNLNNGIPFLDEKRSFSLIFRGAKTLDLMVDEGGDREQILYILNSIVTEYGRAKVKVGNEVLLLRYIWNDVDRDDSNTINEKEMGELLNRINFQTKEKNHGVVYQKFAKTLGLSKDQRKAGLTFDQCVTLLHKTKRDTWQVKPVTQLFFDMFGQFMSNNKVRKKVSADSFLNRFLRTVQGEENRTMEDVMHIFAGLHELELADVANYITQPNYISLEQFEAYLLSQGNDIFNPEREKFCKSDMTKPISEYWINSSHNTYLTGHQLTGLSSVEMYTKALYRGCRCIELDIWDGGREEFNCNPIPIVYHGHTMVSKILFEDIIKALQVFLMLHPKTYPLILSLENHCTVPFQQVMASQLKSILGDKLYIPEESSLNGPLPSPHQLRGKVVLKGRRPVGATDDYDTDSDAAEDDMTDVQSVWTEKSSVSQGKVPKTIKIAPELAKLTLFHGTKFKTWVDSTEAPSHHMHSFSESRITSLCKRNQSHNWILYNQTHMSRTFPSGTRIDSGNYSPILAWSTGCQMAALNIQTPDEKLRVNDGRFRENGGSGYVLKPSILMMKEETDPRSTHLEVKILSGSCLPKPGGLSTGECIDPYVKISLFDCHDGREVESSQTTNAVVKNGFAPIWNFEDSFHFDVKNSSVAVMQWTVW